MRTATVCLIALSLTGCGLEILTTTAIQGELAAQNAGVASRVLENAKDSTAEIKIRQAISLYRADKNQNPPSLEALVPQYLESVPTKGDGSPYGYDAASGQLLASPAPAAALSNAGDPQKLQQVTMAVQRYGRETGRYPMTLWSLVPNYLPEYPKTAAGQEFIYDPRTGAVYLPQSTGAAPAQNMAQQPGGRGAVGGGGSLMGEALTGMSISNQLDNMSNAGSSAAQVRAGSSLGRSQAQHDAQQERALNQLGM